MSAPVALLRFELHPHPEVLQRPHVVLAVAATGEVMMLLVGTIAAFGLKTLADLMKPENLAI